FSDPDNIRAVTIIVKLIFGCCSPVVYRGGVNTRHFMKRKPGMLKSVHFWKRGQRYGRHKNMVHSGINRSLQYFGNIFLQLIGIKVAVGINQNQASLLGMVFYQASHRIANIYSGTHTIFLQYTVDHFLMSGSHRSNKSYFIILGIGVLHHNTADKLFKTFIEHLLDIWMIVVFSQKGSVRSYESAFLRTIIQSGINMPQIHIVVFFKFFF